MHDGKIVLPDGMNYRVLVLPDRDVISLPVLKKVRELVMAGATVIGPKPVRGETLAEFAATDAAVQKIAGELWGGKTGKGRVLTGKTAREVLQADAVPPDFSVAERWPPARLDPAASSQRAGSETAAPPPIDYIHRTTGDADIYFVANRTNLAISTSCAFRVRDKAPELWNPVTGERKFAREYEDQEKTGRTVVPLDFAPYGSWFVVFRESAEAHPTLPILNSERPKLIQEISGAWTVHFDPKWGGPETAQFDALASWPTRQEPGIKFYSGTATYKEPSTFRPRPSALDPRLSSWI